MRPRNISEKTVRAGAAELTGWEIGVGHHPQAPNYAEAEGMARAVIEVAMEHLSPAPLWVTKQDQLDPLPLSTIVLDRRNIPFSRSSRDRWRATDTAAFPPSAVEAVELPARVIHLPR